MRYLCVIDAQTRAMREKLAMDPHRPGYHFLIMESKFESPFDPNGAIFWKGRYHLFYIFLGDRGYSYGHASSIDLIHWRHHPTGLIGGMFSGNCFINKDGVPTMCYHDDGRRGNTMAVALDDQLNEWRKLALITPETKPGDPHHGKYDSWDPYGWLEEDTYYAIFGGKRPAIAKCDQLSGDWKYVGDLMDRPFEGVDINEDISCPDFFKIRDKHMLLCISHQLGSRYYLGEWKNEKFYPESHARMSWADEQFFAPESLLDDKGRRIMWAWLVDGRSKTAKEASGWTGTMSLPRVLDLDEDGTLLMWPPKELERLRYNPKELSDLTVKADTEMPLKDISGSSYELEINIVPEAGATQYGAKVCVSPDGREETLIYYDAAKKKLTVDTRKASSLTDPSMIRWKNVEAGPFELKPGEPLKLRIFVDKSVVEVFANKRQAITRQIYPSLRSSVGVVLFSKGGSVKVPKLRAWEMMESNPY